MSITNNTTNCQYIATTIQDSLRPFSHEVDAYLTAEDTPLSLSMNSPQLALFTALLSDTQEKIFLILPEDVSSPKQFHKEIEQWVSLHSANANWHYVSDPLTEQERDGVIHTELSDAYHHLLRNNPTHHFLITPAVLEDTFPNPDAYRNATISLTIGEEINLQSVTKKLTEHGYIRNTTSISAGSFRVHGERIDIWPPASKNHYSITLYGTAVEKIILHAGRRTQELKTATIYPVTFPESSIAWKTIFESSLVIRPAIHTAHNGNRTIELTENRPAISFPLSTSDGELKEESSAALFLIYTNKDRTDEYVRESALERTVYECESALAQFPITLRSSTWELKTEAAIFPEAAVSGSAVSYERALELISELTVGKPAVHTDHGIGIYEGLQRRQIEDIEKEYLTLRYAEGDALYVPVEYAYKITPYMGSASPPVYRLGGTLWQKTKKKAKEDAVAFAKELLAISRKRSQAAHDPYVLNKEIDRILDDSFPFELTPDQKQTLADVQADMQKQEPMDRLIVGDVGFGKTEIAIRAARHAVANGKQVAVLAPTTLLVQQHLDTFSGRLQDIKNRIYLLSRFVSSKDQKQAREAAASGEADIVIGTHGLLSSKMEWKQLGLVIIDEEQKFGVKQKEYFKQIRAHVDVLSLSATPIPRTLSMALSGLRQLSIISTPPEGRRGIKTYVKKVDLELIKNVISRELARKGQVYVVAPKIRHLASVKQQIESIIPDARIAIAHAKLPDKTLSAIIHDFDEGNIDILISSSIVENGLDLPNVNTMIVWHAQHFGLAELYQLRGRIGRRQRQGYAYFLYNQDRLTEQQRLRLTALTEASRLGSGWEIARRDLEIRGAGNLLGAEQSGSVKSVGVGLYLDLIHQAVEGEEDASEVDIQLPITALIPAHYINQDRERTRWYTRITRSKEQQSQKDELTSAYGHLPQEVENLFLLVELQHAAAAHDITKIQHRRITPSDEDPYDRIMIEGTSIPQTLQRLSSLGNWVVRGNAITLDVDAVSPQFIQSLINALQA